MMSYKFIHIFKFLIEMLLFETTPKLFKRKMCEATVRNGSVVRKLFELKISMTNDDQKYRKFNHKII